MLFLNIMIDIATASSQDAVRLYGSIPNTTAALDAFIRKMTSTGAQPHFVYEAGPGGYHVYRHIQKKGFICMVAAPALIPRKAGDKVKTDERDAVMLARLYRAGELTAVNVPDEEDEAVRDMFRARCDAKNMKKSKAIFTEFLLRLGVSYHGVTNWTKTHFSWLDTLDLSNPVRQLTLQEYLDTVKQCQERVARLNAR